MSTRPMALLALLTISSSALAVENLNYNYIELGYETGEIDVLGTDIDATAFSGFGSYALTDSLAITAGAATGEVETSDHGPVPDVDTRDIALGLTPHFSLKENVDLVIPVAIHRAKAKAGTVSDSETGYSIGIGVRALVTDMVELAASVQHIDIEDDEQSIGGSARFHANESVSFALSASFGDDTSSVGISGRLSF